MALKGGVSDRYKQAAKAAARLHEGEVHLHISTIHQGRRESAIESAARLVISSAFLQRGPPRPKLRARKKRKKFSGPIHPFIGLGGEAGPSACSAACARPAGWERWMAAPGAMITCNQAKGGGRKLRSKSAHGTGGNLE